MIVYGDPHYIATADSLIMGLRRRLAGTRLDSLEDRRTLLIQTGEFEQAFLDFAGSSGNPDDNPISAVTNWAAEAFVSAWTRPAGLAPYSSWSSDSLDRLRRTLAQLNLAHIPHLTVKIPEGFAFYTLFPEQYCQAALKWAGDHKTAHSKTAAVVGIRSIGTTLSAIVSATLKSAGWSVTRFTVRPGGPPFSRTVELPLLFQKLPAFALVVDEGPGISGSSMAAVARALQRAGVSQVSFFPGHNGDPGTAASTEIRQCWRETPRYTTAPDELKWNGESLPARLAIKTRELINAETAVKIADVSNGQWRRIAFASKSEYPAIAGRFERTKFLCSNGEKSVLWKFSGLSGSPSGQSLAELAFEQLSARAREGFSPKPLGICDGFIAIPWINGRRLTPVDGHPAVLNRVGDYIVRSAASGMSASEAHEAIRRLADMLYWNTQEALGDYFAEATRSCVEAAGATDPSLAYGDGHLAPHEWVLSERGEILKTDCVGHDLDHTIVGRQSLCWDVAGAIIEWNLDSATATHLLFPIRRTGIAVDPQALQFYKMAYAAFRMGLCSLAANETDDVEERIRLTAATDRYRAKLEKLLGTSRVMLPLTKSP